MFTRHIWFRLLFVVADPPVIVNIPSLLTNSYPTSMHPTPVPGLTCRRCLPGAGCTQGDRCRPSPGPGGARPPSRSASRPGLRAAGTSQPGCLLRPGHPPAHTHKRFPHTHICTRTGKRIQQQHILNSSSRFERRTGMDKHRGGGGEVTHRTSRRAT